MGNLDRPAKAKKNPITQSDESRWQLRIAHSMANRETTCAKCQAVPMLGAYQVTLPNA